jgi:hypothetical protein
MAGDATPAVDRAPHRPAASDWRGPERVSEVVGCVLNALQDLRLVVLPLGREFLDALLGRVDSLRDSLRVARLSRAIWSALVSVAIRLIQRCVVLRQVTRHGGHLSCHVSFSSARDNGRGLLRPVACRAIRQRAYQSG